jgi:hypothetical protein
MLLMARHKGELHIPISIPPFEKKAGFRAWGQNSSPLATRKPMSRTR